MKGKGMVGCTPFPNFLFEVMPKLHDTEWRVLCVIVRSTLGWTDPITRKRKRRDWISHHQLIYRTGRYGTAVSRAIDALVQAKLIQVTDALGRPLLDPKIRRRHHGRIYFAIEPALLKDLAGD